MTDCGSLVYGMFYIMAYDGITTFSVWLGILAIWFCNWLSSFCMTDFLLNKSIRNGERVLLLLHNRENRLS